MAEPEIDRREQGEHERLQERYEEFEQVKKTTNATEKTRRPGRESVPHLEDEDETEERERDDVTRRCWRKVGSSNEGGEANEQFRSA